MSLLPSNPNPALSQALIDNGILTAPIHLIDIGARRGLDPRWQPVSALIRAAGFEIDEAEVARLNQAAGENIRYFPYALAGKTGTATLHIRQNVDASGIVPFPNEFYARFANASHTRVEEQRSIRCVALDDVWHEMELGGIDFLKIDAEGAEREILDGAAQVLDKHEILGAELEVRFFNFGQQSRYCELHERMARRNLHFFDIGLVRHSRRVLPNREELMGTMDYPNWRSGSQVIAADALFLRDLVMERQNGRIFSGDDADTLLKMMVVFEIYELYDCIAELLTEFEWLLKARLNVNTALDLVTARTQVIASYQGYLNTLRLRM